MAWEPVAAVQQTTTAQAGTSTRDCLVFIADQGGTWTGTPTLTFTRQWQRCNALGASCINIAGATATTYQATPADVAGTLRVVVTAANAAGPVPATSAPTSQVAAAPPVNTVATLMEPSSQVFRKNRSR